MSWTAALAVDEDSRPEYTAFLHLRGDRETFEAARSLCGDADPVRGSLAPTSWANWAQSGSAPKARSPRRGPFRTSAATVLHGHASTKTVNTVQEAIATSLGHLADPRTVELLGRWCTHSDVEVRWSVCLASTPLPPTTPTRCST